jgi:hypothetical protein
VCETASTKEKKRKEKKRKKKEEPVGVGVEVVGYINELEQSSGQGGRALKKSTYVIVVRHSSRQSPKTSMHVAMVQQPIIIGSSYVLRT